MTSTHRFRLGQAVQPNSQLRGIRAAGRTDDAGAYFPLVTPLEEHTNAHIPWDVKGVVTELYGMGVMVVSFPQGLALTREAWVSPVP
jgi:hypothetical protein